MVETKLFFGNHRSIDDVVAEIQSVQRDNILHIAKEILGRERAISIIAPKETIEGITFI